MTHLKNTARIVAIAAVASFSLTACVGGAATPPPSSADSAGLPQAIKDAGVLRVGTSPDFPPMEFREGDKLVGVDIELQEKLSEVLGVKIEVVESKFDQLINSVQTSRVDMVMSGISDTVERQKTGEFVDYFKSQGNLYTSPARAAEFTKQSDICGKSVAVSGKTDYFEQVKTLSKAVCADQGLPEVNTLATDSGAAARLQIDQGRADLAVQGAENLAYFAKTEPGKYETVLEALPAKPFGVMVKKGDTQLAEAVKAAFDEIIESGDYQKILDKWGVGYGSMTPEINGTKP